MKKINNDILSTLNLKFVQNEHFLYSHLFYYLPLMIIKTFNFKIFCFSLPNAM